MSDVLDYGTPSKSDYVQLQPGPSRFREPVSYKDVCTVRDSRFPKKTVSNATWAVTLFGQWRAHRNVRCMSGDQNCGLYLDKPFTLMDESELNYALPLFLCEVRKQDGSEYPPETLRQLIACLQKHMEIEGRSEKFLSDVKYKGIQDTLDGLMKQRSKLGMSLEKRQAQVITHEMEEILWTSRLLGQHNPQTLFNTVVYVLGLHLALRGRDEHRCLRHYPSQLSIKTDENGLKFIEYREDVSKTFGGGLHSGKQKQKVTRRTNCQKERGFSMNSDG